MVMFTDIHNCRGLAVDWLSRNMYWLSSENEETQINVARLDGALKTSVIHGIDKPRCLAVHPAKGYEFYCIFVSKYIFRIHFTAVLLHTRIIDLHLIQYLQQNTRGQ